MVKLSGIYLAPLPALLFLGLGVTAFQKVADQAPALRESLQVETITGSYRLTQTEAMYDLGSYLFQVGHGYLAADVLSFEGLEEPGEVASFETADARMAQAEALFARSLSRDPANAHTWLAYAEALFARGQLESAEDALLRSFELGPTTWRLAYGRLSLLDAMHAIGRDMSGWESRSRSDRATLRRYQPRLLQFLSAD